MTTPLPNIDDSKEYLYRVDKYEYGQISCSGEGENAYPKYNLSHSASVISKTWEDALDYVKQEVLEDRGYGDLHHFIVKRLKFGGSPDWGDTVWLIDNKGNIIDHSLIGRPNEHLRFRQGDIVETVTINLKEKSVSLAVIVKEPLAYPLHRDDDCYLIARKTGAKPEKAESIKLMKPRFPISNDLKEYFQKCLETVDYDQKSTKETQFPYGFALGGFGLLEVCLDVDPITETPHLHIVDKNCKFVVNLRIDRPEYFTEDATSDTLQDYQINELMDYLTENINGKTRWWYMLRRFWEWYDDYNLNIPLDTPLPDYHKLIKNNRDNIKK